ncbi:facilitated trehalose transporter Tret1-2 homolog [Vanessa cardui]|uniref:facilitated trehalose transporter Tret1-2 homolog n=1 Tax=Vanessa cardui TaxID=171605 RepID=UPI001F12DF04|nr:facilitated trehalose transporter Tret1-2 homolog [Vanessa cardui]XP_046973938.1 facilitated trehalose transporter Tret1-2 homolog [Vanessa cardui]XP_046973939.1 facilitated trehalose transporter Tret1-2 homolog [Vanessa cardui]
MGEDRNENEADVIVDDKETNPRTEEPPETPEPDPEDNMQKQMNAAVNKEVAMKYADNAIRQRENEKTYIQNIKNSNSGLSLGDLKEDALLADSKTVARFSPAWNQTLASTAAILMTFTAGLTSGYSAILLPQLKESGSSIPCDESTASWIAAMAALPMAPGCLICGWLMEKFGRRNAHYMVCAPFLLGWILIACANNLALILLGRFFTGMCVGLIGPLGPVFISETCSPQLRGIFLAAISLAIAVGILVSHLIGTWVHWQWTAIICCIFPILSVILLSVIPESPTWLISKGQIEDGVKAFSWLRGYGDEARAELKAIIDKRKAADLEPTPTLREKINSLKSPELMKPLFIMIVFFVTCQFSGVNAVAFYSIEIIEKAVGKGIDHYVAMLAIDSLRTVMSVVACVTCKKYGRRPLCLISGLFTAISMVGLSMFLYWTDGKPTNLTWIPLSCLMGYICAISIGLVPLPWMMCGEVFPTRVRGLGSGISSATTFVSFFIVVKTAPGMMSDLGEVLTFLFYGIVALVGTGILYFILPETKGKSLQEIEDKFKSGKISIA